MLRRPIDHGDRTARGQGKQGRQSRTARGLPSGRRVQHGQSRSGVAGLVAFCLAILSASHWGSADSPASRDDGRTRFRQIVLPLLNQKCFRCHSGSDASSGIRLDQREALLDSTGNSPLIRLGDAEHSHLIQRIEAADPAERMPPPDAGHALSASEQQILRSWIDDGLSWDFQLLPSRDAAERHWAFQPIRRPELPVDTEGWSRTPVDLWIRAAQLERGLKPADDSEPAQLLRRLSLDLTGLPPSKEVSNGFLTAMDAADTIASKEAAIRQLVDALLDTPAYAERWGRFWLDLAHWSESDGYEANDLRKTAWRYRDYVLQCFREDRPHDRFLREQLAGDELTPYSDEQLIATGFLSSTRINNNEEDQRMQLHGPMVEITNLVGSSLLGLTLSCAQCHDHKFDPLTAADYYALLGYFQPGQNNELFLQGPAAWQAYRELEVSPQAAVWRAELEEFRGTARQLAWDAFQSQQTGAVLTAAQTPPIERTSEQWELLKQSNAPLALSDQDLWARLPEEQRQQAEARRYRLDEHQQQLKAARPTVWAFYSPHTSPHPIHNLPPHGQYPFRYSISELLTIQPYVLERGDVHRSGQRVERRWPAIFNRTKPANQSADHPSAGSTGTDRPDSTAPIGSRRELADWLTARDNPLTARVWVNFVWQQHFGRGLVDTPGDFGLRGSPPSHPELLDWLAADLIEHGWSNKHLHRQIVLSRTFRQSSHVSESAARHDSDNRWLTRWQTRRLEAEAIRDQLLAVSGQLDQRWGGESVSLDQQAASRRRSVYLMQKRYEAPLVQALFDGPSMLESCPRRVVSTVPLQPLFLLNHELPQQAATHWLKLLLAADPRLEHSAERLIDQAFREALCRPADEQERSLAFAFLVGDRPIETTAATGSDPAFEPITVPAAQPVPRPRLQQLLHAILNLNEFHYIP